MGSRAGVIEYLEAGLRAAGLRQSVIANNIANLDTPGYRRSAVEFEKCLAEALSTSGPVDLTRVQAEIIQPMTTPVKSNGNDVSLDTEVGELIKNSGTYKLYLRLMGKVYSQMELAIRG
jgi:flagellar basal-body rod protein FlgB